MLLMELLRTVPDRCPPEQGRIPHERSELDRYRLCLGMRVSHQHPWVSVAANGGDFRHVETLLEEPADGLVTKIVEPQGYDLRVSTIRKRQESITRSAAVLVITHPLIALANHGGPRVRIATQTGLRTPPLESGVERIVWIIRKSFQAIRH